MLLQLKNLLQHQLQQLKDTSTNTSLMSKKIIRLGNLKKNYLTKGQVLSIILATLNVGKSLSLKSFFLFQNW